MAATRQPATTPARGRSIGSVQSRLPVVEKETIDYAFYITTPAPRQFRGQYGDSWSITCANAETGEKFVILMGGNALRDQDMQALAHALAADSSPFGPLVLEKDVVKGREVWNLVDAPDTAPSTETAS